MSDLTRARERIRGWKENPLKFVWDNFKVDLDEWQKDALPLMGGLTPKLRRQVAMKACTGPGKSAVLAWTGWYRLACYADRSDHPKGAALSGQGRDNLRDTLWAELAKWQSRSQFLQEAFEWNREQIVAKDHRETWFLSARSYAKDADGEAIGRSLSGLHSPYPFVLLDEMGDMPTTVGQKAEQIFTGGTKDGLIAGAGNPTSTTGLLYFACIGGQWHVITITADPDDPKRTPRVPVEHAREQIRLYGRDNPWVMATILGLFPPGGFNTLLSVEQVEAAMNRHYREDQYSFTQKRLGIDVAREGNDRTVIFPRQGLAAFRPVIMRTQFGPDIAARVITAKTRWGSEIEFFDDTGGWAGSAIDSMLQSGQTPQRVNFASSAIDPGYKNKRAEMWFAMADWVKRGGALPRIQELVGELTTPTYTFQNGKFLLEPKEKVKERLLRSPDLADALCLTFALPEMPAKMRVPGQKAGTLESEWNPYAEREAQAPERLTTDWDPYSVV
jgi:phage terminase large subunit